MNKRNTFIIAVALPILILLAMTIKPATTVLYGQEILLETRAVDPNDLFRGDYVALAFKVSDLPIDKLPDSFKQYSGKKALVKDLYVSLKQEGKFWVIDQVTEEKPVNGIYLKGKVQYYNYEEFKERTVHIDYSLDKYFVPQGSGMDLQNQSRKGELVGKVKVRDGYGILMSVEPGDQ